MAQNEDGEQAVTEAQKIRAKRLAALERSRLESQAPTAGGEALGHQGNGESSVASTSTSPGSSSRFIPSGREQSSPSTLSKGSPQQGSAQRADESPRRFLKQKTRLPPALQALHDGARTLSANSSGGGGGNTAKADQPSLQAQQHFSLSYEEWAGQSISRNLGITLDQDTASQSQGRFLMLSDLRHELEREGRPGSVLPIDDPDRIILARMSVPPAGLPPTVSGMTTFDFLSEVWTRLVQERRSFQARPESAKPAQSELQRRLDLLDKLKGLAISYAGLIVQDPSMFPQPQGRQTGHAELVNILVASVASEPASQVAGNALVRTRTVMAFVAELVERFQDDGLRELFEPVMQQLCINPLLNSMELIQPASSDGSGWREHDILLERLLQIKALANVLVEDRSFNAKTIQQTPIRTENIEKYTLPGPLTRLSLFVDTCPSIVNLYFKNAKDQNREELQSTMTVLRGSLALHQRSLFNIYDRLVRAGPESKEAVLDYWSRIANENHKRGAIQVDATTVSTDGFMMNLATVLLEFAKPFSGSRDPNYSKLDKITPDYLRQCKRIQVKEETRLKATAEEAAEWHAAGKADNVNFISEIFYLTLAHLHYGLHRSIVNFNETVRVADQIEEHVAEMGDGEQYRGTPMAAQFEAGLARAKAAMNMKLGAARAAEVQLLNPPFTDDVISFYNLVMTWLIRLVDPAAQHPVRRIRLPLPEEIPDAFRFLPEYIIEDVTEFLAFVSRHQPQALARASVDELITFCMTFLSSTWYIKNPYLKAKLIDVLFFNTLAYPGKHRGALGDAINSHPLALRHMMPALMGFYIEVESTGLSSQFYDKFNIRYHIAHIWKSIWATPDHRAQLAEEAKNHDKFVRFVNLLMNDCTYLLDEGLSKLALIHDIQILKSDDRQWSNLNDEEKKDKERSLREAERMARSYVALGNETLSMLERFTAETAEPFVSGEIVDRLAAMLNFNLSIMAGPRMQQLRVEKPDEYHFKPRQLLTDLIQIYLNLAHKSEFIAAIANDGRSYKQELFVKVGQIAMNRALKTSDEIQRLSLMVQKVEALKVLEREEEEMGDIPDKYLDPLMATLMRDPVILPSSKIIVDRSTIKSHLLSDANDPFNRQPLKIEQVVDDVELRKEIELWQRERRESAKASQMDTS